METRTEGRGRARLREGITLLVLAVSVWATGQACASPGMTPLANAATSAQVSANYGKLPLSFEINRGQTDSQVRFLARGQGYGLFLTPQEAVLSLRAAQPDTARTRNRKPAAGKAPEADERSRSAVVRMRLARANANPEISGLDPLPGASNYFIGSDPGQWQTQVAHYARVKYAGVYPGIDLVYYGNQRQLEYDFVLAPGADPKRIEMEFEGARRLWLDKQGNLILATAGGKLVQHKPVVYQESDGKRTEVEAWYVLRGGNRAGFNVASHDASLPLVIDPVLSYSTFLGGSGLETAYGITVDASGNAYVTGKTASTDFPTTAGAQRRVYGGDPSDAFVTKLNAAGTAIVYSTYLGGSGQEEGDGIAVDANGNVYVYGQTTSSDFPTTAGAYQRVYGGGDFDVFVVKLDSMGGRPLYATFIGGTGSDASGYGYLSVDAGGNVYAMGITTSRDFPTTVGALQRVYGGGANDAFVIKLNPAGTALVYSTYLGGNDDDEAYAIAVDAGGNAYVTGYTASTNFPTTAGAYQRGYGGGILDVFVTKLNATGTALVYSTYLGGRGEDGGYGIAVDANGNAYIAGYTTSTNFPTTAAAYQTVYGGGPYDAFVTKLNANGTALVYSTFIGGNGDEGAFYIVVDASGNAYIAGNTSGDFPITAGAYQTVYGGDPYDGFLTKLNATGKALIYSTLLGGSDDDAINSVTLDGAGNAYVAGRTRSSNFSVTPGAYQRTPGGDFDAFVAKISGLGALQVSQSDCLFNWAEITFPTLFVPAGAISSTVPQLYFRYYSQTGAYLAAYSADNHFYYLGPLSNNLVFDLGALSVWFTTAGCA